MKLLDKVVTKLIDNKNFPHYQSERRVDIFLDVILEEILTVYFNNKITYVCPEFPLKKEDSYKSTKLDYLCKNEDDPEVIFIEFKTDPRSFDLGQLDIYSGRNTGEKDWGYWNDALLQIVQNTTYNKKYDKLISRLNEVSLNEDKYNSARIRVIYISPLLTTYRVDKLKRLNYEIRVIKPLKSVVLDSNIDRKEWNVISPLFTIPGEELYLFEITLI